MIKTGVKVVLSLAGLIISFNVLAHGMSEEDKQRILDAGIMEFVELGASHMLTGYDHLLFLFGVIFFLTRFSDIVKFITAFTIGHSITLIFATLYQIQANVYLVDAFIAITVCYKAFENLDGFTKLLNYKAPNLLWMVFGFGLIHGFGLSTRLQQLPLVEEGLVLDIIAFNVGVEIGQIAALVIMLFLLSGWRKSESFSHFTRASNMLLMLAGFMLLLMQLHSYQHSVFTDEFPLNRDDHYHIHEEMDAPKVPSALDGYKKRVILPSRENTSVPDSATSSGHVHDDGVYHSH